MVQKPVTLSVEVENPCDISMQGLKSCSGLQESEQTQHQNQDSLIEPEIILINESKDTVIEEIRSPKNKQNSWKTSLFEMISNNILSYVHPTRLLMSMWTILMVPVHAYKDHEDVDEVLAIDSGIGSNIGNNIVNNNRELVLYEPGLRFDVEVDSPPGNLESNPDPALSPSPLPVEEGPIPHFHLLLQSMTEEPPAPTHQEGRDEVAEYPQYRHWIPSSTQYGVRPGTKQQLQSFVSRLGSADQDTGVFLKEFVSLYNINNGRFYLGDDYVKLSEFSTGREVSLCQAVVTHLRFVTKMVPLEDVSMPARGDNSVPCVQRLRHHQQVNLVLGLQDFVPWVAKIHGIIKRNYGGRPYGEVFMEFCPGGTLKDNLLSVRSLTLMAKWRLSKNIVDIVGQLHQQTIVHGDLKPDNICFRGDEIVLIDFESGKNPLYESNSRATCLYLAPWIRDLKGSDIDLLKTMDLWSVGMILLDIVFDRLLWGREYTNLLICHTCDSSDGRCQHVQHKLIRLMDTTYPQGLTPYLPAVIPEDDPIQKRLALLTRGLLSTCGPQGQLSIEEAQDALLDENVVIQVQKDGSASIPPLVVKQGTSLKRFMKNGKLQQWKSIHSDLQDGMFFTIEKRRRRDGKVKEYTLQKNHSFTESCVLQVYAPV